MRHLSTTRVGRNAPVLLLHPVGLDKTFWPELPETLSANRTAVAADFAGHGASPDAARPGTMASHVEDIVHLIEGLGLGPAALVGVSFGGMVAQNVALTRPDLVSALVLAACPGEIPAAGRAAIRQRGEAAEAGGMASVVDATLERWFTPEFMTDPWVARVRERLLADTPSSFAATWEAVSEHDALARLGAVTAPALVISGELDRATPLAASEAIAAAIPNARLEVMEGAPHMLQIERAEAFTRLVDGFLSTMDVR